eukprot:gene7866-13744_t
MSSTTAARPAKASIICHPEILRLSCKFYGDFNIVLAGFADTGSTLKTLVSQSRRQCVLECLSFQACQAVNFKSNGGDCELVGRGLSNALVAKAGWVYLTTDDLEINVGPTCKLLAPCRNRAKCTDTCSGLGYKCTCDNMHTGVHCEKDQEFASCKNVYDSGFTSSGIYKLQGMGFHYCHMETLGECTGPGWTLLMKTHGTKNTFGYTANYWTSSNVYNQVYGLAGGLNGEEAKFEAFNRMAFNEVCLGFTASGTSQYVKISKSATSFLSVAAGGFSGTSVARSKWLSLVSGSHLQPGCNLQGFNAHGIVRIGILANNENDCITPDSYIGIGMTVAYCSPKTAVHGNKACYDSSYDKPANAVLLVK